MNGRPHTHEVKVERRYPALDQGDWMVVYGDTKVKFAGEHEPIEKWAPEFFDRHLRKARDKAITEHDRGSKQAMLVAERIRQAQMTQQELKQALQIPQGDFWASERPQPYVPSKHRSGKD